MAAQAAGIPLLVDPLTNLLQAPIDPRDRWCQLPFARPEAVSVADLNVTQVIAGVVEHQLDHGATTIIAPYLYVGSPSDPEFDCALQLIEATAEYLRNRGIALPIAVVAPFKLQTFADEASWSIGLDRWMAVAADCGAQLFGVCASPLGAPSDNYGKIARAFLLAAHLLEADKRPALVAWHQGFYGPALTAAGFAGYETGIGQGESTDVAARSNTRKVKRDGAGFASSGVFLNPLNRSVERRVGRALLADQRLGAQLLCDTPGCCTTIRDTVEDSRPHAVRARAAQLEALEVQPSIAWRLNHVMNGASVARSVAERANRVLEASGDKYRFKPGQYESLRAVSELLLESVRRAA